MDLVATPWTIIAIFKVLDNAGLTEGVQAFGHGSRLDQIPFADIACNVWIEIFHQVFPLGSHSWLAGFSSSGKESLQVDERLVIPGAGVGFSRGPEA